MHEKLTTVQFCFWLQGFAEVTTCESVSDNEWKIITDTLAITGGTSDDSRSHTLPLGRFVVWLLGFVEITTREPTPQEWKIIKDRLQLVFASMEKSKSHTDLEGVNIALNKATQQDDYNHTYPPGVDPWRRPTTEPLSILPRYDLTFRHKGDDYSEHEEELPGS